MIRLIIAGTLLLAAPAVAKPVVGQIAPEFQLTLIDGSKVKLSELRGQVVLLNFWATWCVPCRTELPLLDSYYKVAGKHGLRVFAITTEDSVSLFKMKTFFAALAIPSVRHIRGGYGVLDGLPTNYIIDRAGRLRYAKAGALDLAGLNTLIIPLLREAKPTTD